MSKIAPPVSQLFSVSRLVGIFALAFAYYWLAQLGLLIPSFGPMVSLLWPSAGLALAVLYRAGIGYWPGIWLGAFFTNTELCGSLSGAIIASGVSASTLAAVWILRRYRFDREFRSLADARVFLIASTAAAGLAAFVGTGTLYALDALRGGTPDRILLDWWLGDLGGMLVVAPGLLAFARSDIRRLRRDGRLRGFLLSSLLIIVAGIVVFSGIVSTGRWTFPATFVILLLVARSAGLYRLWPSSLQIAYIAGWVIWNNHILGGPSAYLDASMRIYAAWAYLITASIVSLGIASLLAERDAVERQLKAGEETYRALVHDNPALIGRFSTDGRLLYVNETFRRAFQLPAFESPVADSRANRAAPNFYLITGLVRDAMTMALLRELNAPERPIHFESRREDGTATERTYRWTARAVDLSSSAVSEYHVVGLDMTDQKRVETERKALETQAIQTQQYEAIGVLAGGIAHEFNNILTGLIGNADLAKMMLPRGAEVQPMLADILRGAERAAELTKQLSTYAGQTDTDPQPHSIGDIVRSCERLVEIVLSRNGTIRYVTKDEAIIAIVDDSKIRQLFLGLVTNAAESFPGKPGSIEVRVGTRCIDENSNVRSWTNGAALRTGEYVELWVSDNGCGMDATTLARVFEPFFTTKFPGRGLGMSAVLGIVQDHLGAIRVESEVDRGTSVRVLLPTISTSIDFPTPLPRSLRRSSGIAMSRLTRR